MLNKLQVCLFDSWLPTIGDPTFIGWVTVIFYVIAALLAMLVLFHRSSNQRAFWLTISVFLILLSVNKQLDLQSAFTTIGRCSARIQGWYEQRETIQVVFIVSFFAASLIFTAGFAWALRKGLSRIWLAFLGFSFLLTFVVMRAASFHNFDRFIEFGLGALRLNWLFELTGITMIAFNAIGYCQRKRA